MAIKFDPHHDADPHNDEMAGDNHRRKAEWHRKRVGKLKNASITAQGKHVYAAELLDAGVAHHHPDHPDHDPSRDIHDHDDDSNDIFREHDSHFAFR